MGILNITPDSFSDGGKFQNQTKALKHAQKLLEDGADILDIGAESSRPFGKKISYKEEQKRLFPILELIKKEFNCLLSVDTYKAQIMKQAVDCGADMINDIYALRAKNSLETASKLDVPICLMHMQNRPQNMQSAPKYENVVVDVCEFLKNRSKIAQDVGIKKENIILDPGFGFGKTKEHNLDLIKNISELKKLDFPMLFGISRKKILAQIAGDENKDLATAIASAFFLQNGVNIIRVHNVKETKIAKKLIENFK